MPISIIIPTKDRPFGLLRAVASARAALPTGGEIVVVDDHGMVPALDVLEECMGPDMMVIKNAGPRSGPSAARNAGVAAARHPLVLFLDDDDELLPEYPQRILHVAWSERDVSFGRTARLRLAPGRKDKVQPCGHHPGKHGTDSLLTSRIGGAGGLWIRRGTFLDVGGFDEELVVHEDNELCMRLAKVGATMWADAETGYVVHARQGGPDADRVMRSTVARERAASYERIWMLHGDLLVREAPRLARSYRIRLFKSRFKAGLSGVWTRLT